VTVADVLGPDFGEDHGDGRGKLYWFHPNGGKSKGTRRVCEPAPTITGKTIVNDRKNYKPKKADVPGWRKLAQPTPEQFSRIQGFPEGWDWSASGSLSAMNQMLANSVPPPLAEAIGKCVLAHSRGERPEIPREFPWYYDDWLRERYNGKALRDQRSLLRTVQGLLGPTAVGPLRPALGLLDRHPALAKVSPQRKANLKGALRLHRECYVECLLAGVLRE
jgi:DNA (cytosine-5)-methyltransferase 1